MPYLYTRDHCRIYFEDQYLGSPKPAIVFLNGTTQTAISWNGIANILKDRFQVLAYDARAQGRSDQGNLPLTLELHTTDLREVLDHVGLAKAILVGISHGASVALAFASSFPERVDRIMLCSVTAAPTCRAGLFVDSWLRILKREGMEAMVWAALPMIFGENFLRQNKAILEKIVHAISRRNKPGALTAHLKAITAYPQCC